MKKGQILEGIVERVDFPNRGIVQVGDRSIAVKNTVPGQKVRFAVNKVRKGKCEGRLLDVLESSALEIEASCPHFADCGGCTYQNLPYEEQLALKSRQLKSLMDAAIEGEYVFEGVKESPLQFGYRNKMEFSFGDEEKNGPLALGMHKRGSFHDIVTVGQCQIVDEDYQIILSCVADYFRGQEVPFYHKLRHTGYLRHLLVRKGAKTGEILVVLVTSTQMQVPDKPWVDLLLSLDLKGKLVGILHAFNDSLADVVQSDHMEVLYGQDFFYEELLGLRFKISHSLFSDELSGRGSSL